MTVLTPKQADRFLRSRTQYQAEKLHTVLKDVTGAKSAAASTVSTAASEGRGAHEGLGRSRSLSSHRRDNEDQITNLEEVFSLRASTAGRSNKRRRRHRSEPHPVTAGHGEEPLNHHKYIASKRFVTSYNQFCSQQKAPTRGEAGAAFVSFQGDGFNKVKSWWGKAEKEKLQFLADSCRAMKWMTKQGPEKTEYGNEYIDSKAQREKLATPPHRNTSRVPFGGRDPFKNVKPPVEVDAFAKIN
eukprot:CAMPEP_0204381644 /NCGR_PEP_ID=MMETSP0469-20131031/54414_1 /ASSEMBLY_ACC=CAM_ASM_000384 /TAXON_ID=2969 /ORGANISM="Oxyrrhis marina" /LENGTH=242 /DNA_ID=CAMNT_0051373533 /DNA_START=6 /DNA_END=731 /DNA_ORIENTATION=-